MYFEQNFNFRQETAISAGAVYVKDVPSLNINGATFTYNGSVRSGGAVTAINIPETNISNIVANENVAGDGGFMYADNTKINLTNSTFDASRAIRRGAVFYVKDSDLNITANAGHAETEYVPISATESIPVTKWVQDKVEFNYGEAKEGGAIYITRTDSATSTFNIEAKGTNSVIFRGNDAENAGAISIDKRVKATFKQVNFIENWATDYNGYSTGGAINIHASSELSIDKAEFEDNRANMGGALFVQGASSSTTKVEAKVTIANSKFTQEGNYSNEPRIVVATQTYIYNTLGGAIFVGRAGKVIVKKETSFSNNYNAVHVEGGWYEHEYIIDNDAGTINFSGNVGQQVIGYNTWFTQTRILLFGGVIKDNTAAGIGTGVATATWSEAERTYWEAVTDEKRLEEFNARKVQIRLAGGLVIFNNGADGHKNLILDSDMLVNIQGRNEADPLKLNPNNYKIWKVASIGVTAPRKHRVYRLSWIEDVVPEIESIDVSDIFISDVPEWGSYELGTTVYIGPVHLHTICGFEKTSMCPHTNHRQLFYQEVLTEDDLDGLHHTSVQYFLANDIEITRSHDWPISTKNNAQRFSLCLNGHKLIFRDQVTLFENVKGILNIVDCQKDLPGKKQGEILFDLATTSHSYNTGNKTRDKVKRPLFFVDGHKNGGFGAAFEMYMVNISSNPNKDYLIDSLVKTINVDTTVENVDIVNNKELTGRNGLFHAIGEGTLRINDVLVTGNKTNSPIFIAEDDTAAGLGSGRPNIVLASLSVINNESAQGIVYVDGASKVNFPSNASPLDLKFNTKWPTTINRYDANGVEDPWYVPVDKYVNSAAGLTLKNIQTEVKTAGQPLYFEGNTNYRTDGDGNPGALYVENTLVQFSSIHFKDNEAAYKGGGIYAKDCSNAYGNKGLTLTAFEALNNKAFKGGFIYIENSIVSIAGSSTYKNNFYDNEAYKGAAIYAADGTDTALELSKTNIYHNKATSQGAGIFAENEVYLTVADTEVYENEARFGAAFAFDGTDSASIRESIISTNSSITNDGFSSGGAIFAQNGAQVALSANTFAANNALFGGAIFARGSDTEETKVDITNASYWLNHKRQTYSFTAQYEASGSVIKQVTIDQETLGGLFFIADNAKIVANAGTIAENNFNAIHVENGTFETAYITQNNMLEPWTDGLGTYHPGNEVEDQANVQFRNNIGAEVIGYSSWARNTVLNLFGGRIYNNPIKGGVYYGTPSAIPTEKDSEGKDIRKVTINLAGSILIQRNGDPAVIDADGNITGLNMLIPDDDIVFVTHDGVTTRKLQIYARINSNVIISDEVDGDEMDDIFNQKWNYRYVDGIQNNAVTYDTEQIAKRFPFPGGARVTIKILGVLDRTFVSTHKPVEISETVEAMIREELGQ